MALIQIRDVPEEAYERIRSKARSAGQSIQAYMREQVIRLAAVPSPEELENWVEEHGIEIDVEQLIADKNSGRP